MRKVFLLFCLTLTGLTANQAQTHPRILFGPNDWTTILSRASNENDPSGQIWKFMKEKQADYYKDPTRQIQLCTNPWQMESLLSLALAYYIVQDPNRSQYRDAVRNIVLGGGQVPAVDALVNRVPNAIVGQWERHRYLTAQVQTLSIVTDVFWNEFSSAERVAIGRKVHGLITEPAPPQGEPDGLRARLSRPWYHIQNNHLAREAQALVFAAIAFHDLRDEGGAEVYLGASSDLARVRQLIVTNVAGKKNIIVRLYDTHGASVEGIEYGLYGLTRSLPIVEALTRFDNTDYYNGQEIADRLSHVADWVAYEVLPFPRATGYIVNNINDSNLGSDSWTNGYSVLGTLLTLGGRYSTQSTRWVFENTAGTVAALHSGTGLPYDRWSKPASNYLSMMKYNVLPLTPPEDILPKTMWFKQRGLVVVRSSPTVESDAWADASDVHFALEGAPAIDPLNNTFSIKHDHADKGHFILNAFGDRLIVDLGKGAPLGGQRPESHNYILIDDKGQAIGTVLDNGVEIDDWVTRPGKIVQCVDNEAFTYIHHDAYDAFRRLYDRDDLGNPVPLEQGNTYFNSTRPNAYVNPVLNADRYVAFIQPAALAGGTIPAYVVIADDINKDGTSHSYEWVWHTRFGISGSNPTVVTGTNATLRIYRNVPGSTIVTKPVTMTSSPASPLDSLGETGSVQSASDGRIRAVSVVNPWFHVMLLPAKNSGSTPIPVVSYPSASGGSAIAATWQSLGYEDFSVFKHSSATVTASNITSNGRLAHVRRTSPGGQVNSFALGEGGLLSSNGTTLVDLFGATGTVLMSGTTLFIAGTGISDFVVYAPSATAVKVNGSSVPFVKAGNYVEAATVAHNRSWTGSVTVATGTTLTILPGITITCSPGIAVTVNGRFLAQGTAQSRIKFTTSSPTTTWSGILLYGTGANNSIAEYCTIERVSGYGATAFSVVGATGFRMSRCRVSSTTSVSTGGVRLTNAGSPELNHNSITGNGTYGVVYSNTSGYFYADTVTGNVTGGVSCNSSSNVMFGKVGFPAYNGNCIISGGSYGVYAAGNSNPTIGTQSSSYYGYNSITSTSTARVYAANSGVLAEKNWWGANPPQSSWFQTSNGAIDWNPYLTSNPFGTLLMPSPAPVPDAKESPSLALTPADVDPLSEVQNARLRGDYSEALSLLSKISVASSDKRLSLRYVGELLAIGHFQFDPTLIELAEKAVDVMGRGTWEELTLARILEIGEMPQKAEEIFKRLPLDAKDPEVRKEAALALFYSYFQTQRINEAEAVLLDRSTKWGEDEASAYAHWLLSIVGPGSAEKPAVSSGLGEKGVAARVELACYPNPFNPTTTIRYTIPLRSHVCLTVFNMLGEKVATLVDEEKSEGQHDVQFNASALASGVYLYRLTAGSYVETRKLVLVR